MLYRDMVQHTHNFALEIAKIVAFGEKLNKSIQIFQIYFVGFQKKITFLGNKFA